MLFSLWAEVSIQFQVTFMFMGIEKDEIEIQEHVCKLIVLYFPVPLVQKLIKKTRFVFLLFKRIFLKKISVFFLEQPIFNL